MKPRLRTSLGILGFAIAGCASPSIDSGDEIASSEAAVANLSERTPAQLLCWQVTRLYELYAKIDPEGFEKANQAGSEQSFFKYEQLAMTPQSSEGYAKIESLKCLDNGTVEVNFPGGNSVYWNVDNNGETKFSGPAPLRFIPLISQTDQFYGDGIRSFKIASKIHLKWPAIASNIIDQGSSFVIAAINSLAEHLPFITPVSKTAGFGLVDISRLQCSPSIASTIGNSTIDKVGYALDEDAHITIMTEFKTVEGKTTYAFRTSETFETKVHIKTNPPQVITCTTPETIRIQNHPKPASATP